MTHEEDREFLRSLRIITNEELDDLLRWGFIDKWKRIAVRREINRRNKNGSHILNREACSQARKIYLSYTKLVKK